jgi:hypothetical protein
MDNSIILSLIEHSSWPIVLLVIVLILRPQIIELVKRLKSLRAGSIEMQIGEQLHNQGLTKKQLSKIGNLTNDEIEIFLLASSSDSAAFNYTVWLPADAYKNKIVSLEEAGLLQIVNPDDPGTNLRHNITPLGKRFRTLLINSAGRLLREAI